MQPYTENQELITSLVNRVMVVASVTTGGQDENVVARYNGRLRKKSEEAYDQLAT